MPSRVKVGNPLYAVLAALVVVGADYGYRAGGLGVLAMMVIGLVLGVVLLVRLSRVELQLREERDLHTTYLRMVGTIVVSLDADLRVTLVNGKAADLLGLDGRERAVGLEWVELTAPPGAADAERRRLLALLAGDGESEAFETLVRAGGGSSRTLSWTGTPMRDPRCGSATLLLSGEDVTERRDAERRMTFLAYNDALTGLANHTTFDVELPAALAAAEACACAAALLLVDVDRFKLVNDRNGHAAGDRLLTKVADRLRGVAAHGDLLVRRGGDEFLLLRPDLGVAADDAAGARRAAGAMGERVADAFAEPFRVAGTTIAVGVSVGIAIYPLDTSDAHELEGAAESAVYALKKRVLDAT